MIIGICFLTINKFEIINSILTFVKMKFFNLSENVLEHPSYQICKVENNKLIPITNGFGFCEDDPKTPIIRGFFEPVVNRLDAFIPTKSLISKKIHTGKILLVKAIMFSENEFEKRFGVKNNSLENNNYNQCEVTRLLILIDLDTGKPTNEYFQYNPTWFNNNYVKYYSRSNNMIVFNTNHIFNGKYEDKML